MNLNTSTMKKSIQLFTVLFISSFFLISVSDLSATTISFYADDYESSLEDKKKNKKKSNDIKTKVTEKENPPANENSTSTNKDEAYNYMSSPKLENCTKEDFDRE